MRKLYRIVLALWLSLSAQGLSATTKTLTTLPNYHISAFAQESIGYMWMATGNGLCRYNGYEYLTFYHSGDDPESLFSNNILDIAIDERDCVWILTDRGINHYDSTREKMSRVRQGTGWKKLLISGDRVVFYGPEGILAVSGDGDSQAEHTSSEHRINTLLRDRQGGLWGTIDGTAKIVRYEEDFMPRKTVGLPDEGLEFTCAYAHDDGLFWYGTTMGVKIFNPFTCEVVNDQIFEGMKKPQLRGNIQMIGKFEQDHIAILLSSSKKLYLHNLPTNRTTSRIKYHIPRMNVRNLTCVYVDYDGTAWFGTYDEGFHVDFKYSKPFMRDLQLGMHTSGKYISSMYSNNVGTLWLGSKYDGLLAYHYDQGVAKWYDPKFKLFADAGGHSVNSLYYDSRKRLWVGVRNSLASCKTDQHNILSYEMYNDIGLVNFISEDARGRIWAGTNKGVRLILPSGKLSDTTLFKGDDIPHIVNLDDGNIIVSVKDRGVFVLDPETLEAKAVRVKGTGQQGLLNDVVTILEDDGTLWFGTASSGLVNYDMTTEEAICYNVSDGLSDNHVCGILRDINGNLWIATLFGLSHFDTITHEFRNYYSLDGLHTNQYTHNSYFYSRNNFLYFGGNTGIAQFKVTELSMRDDPIPVLFEGLEINNVPVIPQEKGSVLTARLNDMEEIVLDYKQNTFRVKFWARSFLSQQKINYAYRLVGQSNEWTHVGNASSATFSKLRPGAYTFEVKAQNYDGVWNDEPAGLRIVVKPSPWLTPWAIILYILVAAGIAVLAVRIYVNMRMRKVLLAEARFERDKEKELSDMKVDFFTNISHELRTPLTMIYGPANMLIRDHGDKARTEKLVSIISYNTQRLLALIDQTLDLGKIENDTLELAVSVQDIVPFVSNFVESFSYAAQEKNIGLSVTFESPEMVLPVDIDKLIKILSNLVSNALKYSNGGGRVEVSVSKETTAPGELGPAASGDGYLVVSVTDDGIGMSEDDLSKLFRRYKRVGDEKSRSVMGSGIGLHYSMRLCKAHKGDIMAERRAEGGMRFTVAIPADASIYDIVGQSGQEPGIVFDSNIVDNPMYGYGPGGERHDGEKATVVIVEDNAELRAFCASYLSGQYNVFTAVNGREGLEIVREQMPDVVITDVMMPVMDGYRLCGEIKQDPMLSHIPVFMLTAKVTDTDKLTGFTQGADAYLPKPFSPDLLAAMLANIITQRNRQREFIMGSTSAADISSPEVKLGPHDRAFLDKLYECIDREISNPEFNVNALAKEMCMSRTNFYRKVKSLLGTVPNEFLRVYRLNKAAELIKEGELEFGEIADRMGFGTQSHFSRSFKKHFGVSPKDYR